MILYYFPTAQNTLFGRALVRIRTKTEKALVRVRTKIEKTPFMATVCLK